MLDYHFLNLQEDNNEILKSEHACLGRSIHELLAIVGERAGITLVRNKRFLERLFPYELLALARNSKDIAEDMLFNSFTDKLSHVFSISPQLVTIARYSCDTFHKGLEELRKEFNGSSIDTVTNFIQNAYQHGITEC